jgi:hypothetical protein
MHLKSIDTFVRDYLSSPKVAVATVSSDHRYEKNYYVEERKEIYLAEFIYAARMLSVEVLIPDYIIKEYDWYIGAELIEYRLDIQVLNGFGAIHRTGRLETAEETLFAKAHTAFSSGRSGYPYITVADAVRTFKNASDYHAWAFSLSATLEDVSQYGPVVETTNPELPSANALPRMNLTSADDRLVQNQWDGWLEYPDDLQETVPLALVPYSRQLLLRKYGFLGSKLADTSAEKFVFSTLAESFSKLPDTRLKR